MEQTQSLGLDNINLLEDDIPENNCNSIGSVSTNNDCGETRLCLVPKVGMTFESVDELKKFYKQHAIRSGFGVRIRTSKKDDDNQLYYAKLVCSQEGTHVSNIPPEKKTILTQRKACPARATIVKKKDEWLIKSVVEEHNHHLSPHKSRLVRGNRKINMQAKRVIDINDQAGVCLNKSFRSLEFEAGGYENLDFVERDVRNYIGQQRRALVNDGDGQALFNHFSRIRELNKDFFFEIDVDHDNRITNVFWADGRSQAACVDFGDIVSFDTTYLTNKYDMPFAPFIGVNHHGQPILLGCGLLSSEDTRTFVWLFTCWLCCMSNKEPLGIVTDQCKAMKNSIEIVFPNARHRWCLWHIMKKVPEKLQGYSSYKQIKHDMKQLVYELVSVDAFECGWDKFITENGLHENAWLLTLYEDRHRWVPCYLKNNFWAGMSTTQRSESMNAFFDGFINSTTTLQQFVVQYENAIRQKAEKECEADFASLNTTIPCGSHSIIERQFQAEYTHAKFAEVQHEFRCKMNCMIKNIYVEAGTSKYHVQEEFMWKGQCVDKYHDVLFDHHTLDIQCTCLLFEFRGILCRHCLVVYG